MAEVVAEVAELPAQSPGTVEMPISMSSMSGEMAEIATEVMEMTPGEALASSLFFQHHQFMCSECGSLYNTLEEVLSHQEQHVPTVPEEEALTTQDAGLQPELVADAEEGPFQCGECSQLILSPSELLAHQDAHLRESASQIQYQCGDCEELFPSPELWVAHRKAQHLSATVAESSAPPPLPPSTPPPPPPEVKMEPYECPECATLCATPEEFLEHQGTHFDSLEKEEHNGLEEKEEDDEEDEEEEEEEEEEEGALDFADDTMRGNMSTADRAQGHDDCSQHCTSVGARQRHRRASRGSASASHPFHCTQCQRSFSSANRLLAHGRAHVGGTHECTACSKVFKKAASLEQHLRLHRGEARYLCVDCGRGFGTELTLVAHRRAHTANPLHRCRCGKTFSNMTKFLYHRRTHAGKSGSPATATTASPAPTEPEPPTPPPPPPAQLPCPQCPKSFASASRLSRHRRAVHGPPERRHRCGVCGKGFKKLVHVRNHLRTHTGERPFQCHSCGKTFASLANLSRHQLTHTGVRPYQCLDCGKRFTQSSNLQQHRRLHLRPVAFARAPRLPITGLYNKSPYYCGTCGRWFRAMAGLRLHQRVHARARSLTLQPPRSPSPAPPPAPEPQQTIMCTELGETIAIIETSQPLALEDTLQLCQAALGASEASGLLQLDTAFV
ncbi:zinc finger protein 526 [Octodon degus]|uniref:Zinc finger protein 526 n=1 Tax=Octodon degus TaxID=10160 RepID=A0A6P6DJX6_OCTDE|nr:zinc finger protein 526 [Octodon degus]XP_023560249.1 zinc finger protein 526 [Octodon degus]XP_023560250.1 zinc finger protein 526 [Octodon degus]XP_023560251.1 zinc finger protein 526 [Octodon degus]XP_023560252.1 zinc finger protein 526 [Octodon degus]